MVQYIDKRKSIDNLQKLPEISAMKEKTMWKPNESNTVPLYCTHSTSWAEL